MKLILSFMQDFEPQTPFTESCTPTPITIEIKHQKILCPQTHIKPNPIWVQPMSTTHDRPKANLNRNI